MKFLCPSCKAKYQIADEKVIGRSVKMKCRQCGYIIEIQEAVVEASAGGGVSQPPIALNSVPAPALAPPPKPAKAPMERAAPRVQPTPEGLAGKPAARPQRPGVGQAHPAAAQPSRNLPAPKAPSSMAHPAVGAPPRQTSSISTQSLPKVAPIERSASAGPASERQAPRPVVARSPGASTGAAGLDALRNLGGQRPSQPHAEPLASAAIAVGATGPGVSTASTSASAHASASRVDQGRAGTGSARRSGDALAEAFATAVVAPAVAEPIVGDEWYVGVEDSPIGPIPLADLRARAARGQVTVDSLVWRDGFEDWKPVRSFPELLAVVEEAISSVNASRGPLSPQRVNADFGPVVSLSPPTERLLQVTAPVVTGVGAAQTAASATSQVVSVVSQGLTPEELAAATGRKPHKTPAPVWVAVGGAVALGLAIGFVLFRPAPAPTVIKYVTVAPSASAAPVAAAPTPSADVQDAPIVASAESISAKARRPVNGEAKAPAESTAVKTATGLSGLQDLRSVGPRTGPGETSANSGSSGGQGLDSATLQKTVSRYTASVRRSCWQPALDSRSPDAPTSARVSVKIDISASGNVSSASSSGDPKGYRGLASCIEGRVRNWTFPPSSGATTVNVPFVFAAQ